MARRPEIEFPLAVIEHTDTLSLVAEISAVFVGFLGILTVLGGRWSQGEWDPIERLVLTTLLFVSLTNLGVALLPLVLVSAFDNGDFVWRVSNGFLGAAHLALWARASRRAPEIHDQTGLSLSVLVPISGVGLLTHLFSLTVAAGFFASLAKFALLWGLWWGIFVSAFAFSILLLLSRSHR